LKNTPAKNVIFLDLDGVIRHWLGTDINLVETRLELQEGALLTVAFSPGLLDRAITGVDTDKRWRENVLTELEIKYGRDSAVTLMRCWENAECQIDRRLLREIKTNFPACKIILTTNATSRLENDLSSANLHQFFHAVVNSSEIGFAKPDKKYFQAALSIARCSISECVYVDDSPENIAAARGLGIKSELHTSAGQTLHFIRTECGD